MTRHSKSPGREWTPGGRGDVKVRLSELVTNTKYFNLSIGDGWNSKEGYMHPILGIIHEGTERRTVGWREGVDGLVRAGGKKGMGNMIRIYHNT